MQPFKIKKYKTTLSGATCLQFWVDFGATVPGKAKTIGLFILLFSSEKLTRPMLRMILNITSENEYAASRIASSNLIGQIIKQFHQFNSQIKIKIKINSLFSLVFRLLENLSISAEARVIFWKGKLPTTTKADQI